MISQRRLGAWTRGGGDAAASRRQFCVAGRLVSASVQWRVLLDLKFEGRCPAPMIPSGGKIQEWQRPRRRGLVPIRPASPWSVWWSVSPGRFRLLDCKNRRRCPVSLS